MIASNGEVTCHLCCASAVRSVPVPYPTSSGGDRFPESKDAGVVHVAPRNRKLNSILSH